MLALFFSDWAYAPIIGSCVPGHLKSLKQRRGWQTYLTESRLPQFLWCSPKGYIHCEMTKYDSWYISALVSSSTTCKLIIILKTYGGPRALLTASYWVAAHVQTSLHVSLCLRASLLLCEQTPYNLEKHFQKEALLPSKVEIALFQSRWSLTWWQRSLLTSKGESIYDALLLPILSCSCLPASYSVSCQIRSMQIRNALIIRRPSADRSYGDHQTVNILGKSRKLWVTQFLRLAPHAKISSQCWWPWYPANIVETNCQFQVSSALRNSASPECKRRHRGHFKVRREK